MEFCEILYWGFLLNVSTKIQLFKDRTKVMGTLNEYQHTAGSTAVNTAA
jgi:hypothetical protein